MRRNKSGTRETARFIRRELKRAIADLEGGHGILPDEAVHEARKRLKKTRAALRLMRDAMGRARFRRENLRLRDIARPLTPVRDAKVVVATLDALVARAPRQDVAARGRMHRALMAQRMHTRKRSLVRREQLDDVRDALKRARRRVAGWRVEPAGWSVLGKGLERVYRAGRTAFAASRTDATVDNLHELRKQAKYLWHQLQLLEPASPRTIRALETRVHTLADRLGDDHDLAVLRARLLRRRREFGPAAVERLVARIDRRRARLQRQALDLGGSIYAARPGAFAGRIARAWRAWRGG
jgi:CHAD domain-containing protein